MRSQKVDFQTVSQKKAEIKACESLRMKSTYSTPQ